MKRLYLILLIISILITTTIFLPAASRTIDNESFSFRGYELVFGKSNISDASGNITTDESVKTSVNLSVFAMVGFTLPCIVLIALCVFEKYKKNLLTFVSICFLVSAILLFLITSVTNLKLEINYLSEYDVEIVKLASLGFKPNVGPILGGCLALGGCLLAGFKGLEKEE